MSMGTMYYWRFKGEKAWRFGYTSPAGTLVRMGRWNGDTCGGVVVDPNEIEVRAYA